MRKIGSILMLLVFPILLAACGSSPISPPLSVSIAGESKTSAGGGVELLAQVDVAATAQWSAPQGTLYHANSKTAVWRAPAQEGTYPVTVTVQLNGKTNTVTKQISVVTSPVQITNSWLTNDVIGGKDAHVTFKNNSGKTVKALRIKIFMWNNFSERVSYLGDYTYRGQVSDTTFAPGATGTWIWSLYWATGVTQILPWVTEVAYSDSSTWTL